MTTTITPCLWFDGNGLEAAEYYVSVIPGSRITDVSHYGPDQPGEQGAVLTVAFELAGRPFTALNGGPAFKFTEAVSLQVSAADQDEIDRYTVAGLAVIRADIRVSMPPNPGLFTGRDAVAGFMAHAFDRSVFGDWKLLPTAANRMPAAASYLRRPGSDDYLPFKLDVLRIGGGMIAEITTFDASLFDRFGLPPTLPGS
jgi:uncharacterized glyoxalase superfamily protein PhnB